MYPRRSVQHSVTGPLLGLLLAALWAPAFAQDSTEVPDPPAIPTAEERAQAERAAQAYREGVGSPSPHSDAAYGLRERRVVEGSTTVTEYSRGGHVYSLKIKPGQGPTQYLEAPGDSQLVRPNDSLEDDPNLPKWRLGAW